ncbi:MAG: hypothetical protein LH702_20310 [Phormidesmis sp. CAN_BIN44]|nr:hypothetical protein [Phormidesmis sp. CAN_BIN44]
MKLTLGNALFTIGLAVGVGVAAPILTEAQTASPIRADWKPISYVNPKAPVRVQFVNNSGEVVEYTLVGHAKGRKVAAGKTDEVSKLPLPVYLEINPVRDRVYVRYGISISQPENLVKIRIQPANVQGDRAFEIDQKGAIYAY